MTYPVYQATGAVTASDVGAVSPAWPVHAIGDIGLLLVETHEFCPAHITANATGWKEVPASPQGVFIRGSVGLNSSSGLRMFWKRATSAAEPAPTVSFDFDHVSAAIVTIRGCAAAGVPFTVSSGVETETAIPIVIPGFTTTTPDQLILAVACNGADNASSDRWAGMTNADLTNIIEQAELNTTVGGGAQMGVYTGQKAVAGAVGASTITMTVAVQGAGIQLAFTAVQQSDDDTPWVSGIGEMVAVSGGVSITPVWPPHLANDIGLLFVESDAWPNVLGTPAGFVEVPDSPQQAGSSGAVGASSLAIYWCRATSGAMANPVVNEIGDHVCARIITIRGCVTTGNPWEVTAGNNNNGASGTAVSVPGDTTTLPKQLIVLGVSNTIDADLDKVDAWANSTLDNLIERFDENSLLGTGGGLAAAVGRKVSPGAFGATTATLTAASHQGRIALSLRSPTSGVRELLGDQGVFTISGQSATVARTRTLLSDQGVFGLTGQPATMTVIFSYTVNGEPGVFSIAGQPATLQKEFGRWRKQSPVLGTWRYQEPEE